MLKIECEEKGSVFSNTRGLGSDGACGWGVRRFCLTFGRGIVYNVKKREGNIIMLNEREHLRALARKYMEYANLPIMKEKENRWYAHNRLEGTPMVLMEYHTFAQDFMDPLLCTDETNRRLESILVGAINNFELIGDDKVIPPYIPLPMDIWFTAFDLPVKSGRTTEKDGSTHAFPQHYEHPITDLGEQYDLIKKSTYGYNKESTMKTYERFSEMVGDIVPVKLTNDSLNWHFALSIRFIPLMGMENYMYAMYDYPELVKEVYDRIATDGLEFVDWQIKNDLLPLNNGNNCMGSGSYCFSDELPAPGYDGVTRKQDLWMHMNSQETVSLSPDMYRDIVFPAYKKVADAFGYIYYGCCEPADPIWDCVSSIENMRKVSVSAWANEEFMGNVLRGSKTIYSRKPSPNFLGVDEKFDEDGFRAHIAHTVKMAQGCKLEIIFRDVYKLCGDRDRAGKAMKITREEIEKGWK